MEALHGKETPFWDIPVRVKITAFYAIPKSFSKKKTEEAESGKIRPLTKPDIDNVVKIVCDALNKVAYRDDTQVIEVVACKYYGKEPKVVIEIDEFAV